MAATVAAVAVAAVAASAATAAMVAMVAACAVTATTAATVAVLSARSRRSTSSRHNRDNVSSRIADHRTLHSSAPSLLCPLACTPPLHDLLALWPVLVHRAIAVVVEAVTSAVASAMAMQAGFSTAMMMRAIRSSATAAMVIQGMLCHKNHMQHKSKMRNAVT